MGVVLLFAKYVFYIIIILVLYTISTYSFVRLTIFGLLRLSFFFWAGDGDDFWIVLTPAFTGDDISLFVGGGAPFAPFVMAFVAFMSFANNNKL